MASRECVWGDLTRLRGDLAAMVVGAVVHGGNCGKRSRGGGNCGQEEPWWWELEPRSLPW